MSFVGLWVYLLFSSFQWPFCSKQRPSKALETLKCHKTQLKKKPLGYLSDSKLL